MKRVATYCRFSSDNQRTESIDAQQRAIKKYCEDKDYMIVKNYVDEALSGTSDERDAFLQMIDDSSKNLFDIVMVHKLDRFSRDRYNSVIYRKQLKDNGVKLISVLENLDDENPEDVIMLSLLEGMAEYYSKNLAREVRKGQMENALKGVHNGGIPPLGFDVDQNTRQLVINEVEAESVRLIFEMYAKQYGYESICKVLNERGFKTKTGRKFTKNSIAEILRNEKYIGHYVFNKRLSKKSGNRKYKDEKDIVKIENCFPAIIDIELWNRKEEILEQRIKPRKNNKRHYLLTGKVFCKCCGGHYVGSSSCSGRNKTTYYFYESSNRKRKVEGCINKGIRAEYLEEYVLKAIKNNILDDNVINDLAVNVYNKFMEHYNKDIKLIKKLESKKETITKKIDLLLDLVLDGTMSKESLKSKSASLQEELDQITIRINEINANKMNAPTVEKIKANLIAMKNNLESEDEDLKQLVIDTFLYEIKIGVNDIEITLVITPNLTSAFKLSSDKVNGDGAHLTLYEKIYKGDIVPKYKKVEE